MMQGLRNRRVLMAAGGLALVLLALAGYAGLSRGRSQATTAGLPDYGQAPAFTLTDQLERDVSSDDLRGTVVLASFVYTNCKDACPLITYRMQTVQQRLHDEGLLDRRVRLVSITVDPARDTPPVLREYAARYQADPEFWRFLTGPEDTVVPLIVDGFRLGVDALPPKETGEDAQHQDGSPPDYDVMHGTRVVLIDRRWRIRAYYDGRELDAQQVSRDIHGLLR